MKDEVAYVQLSSPASDFPEFDFRCIIKTPNGVTFREIRQSSEDLVNRITYLDAVLVSDGGLSPIEHRNMILNNEGEKYTDPELPLYRFIIQIVKDGTRTDRKTIVRAQDADVGGG